MSSSQDGNMDSVGTWETRQVVNNAVRIRFVLFSVSPRSAHFTSSVFSRCGVVLKVSQHKQAVSHDLNTPPNAATAGGIEYYDCMTMFMITN